jgi:ribonucleoside-diphosphate reductase alpha chain
MGFQDCAAHAAGMPLASDAAVEFADSSMEAISYSPSPHRWIWLKSAAAYASFQGSLWSRGILPIDSHQAAGRRRAARSG